MMPKKSGLVIFDARGNFSIFVKYQLQGIAHQ